jgi:hypothetical protein
VEGGRAHMSRLLPPTVGTGFAGSNTYSVEGDAEDEEGRDVERVPSAWK